MDPRDPFSDMSDDLPFGASDPLPSLESAVKAADPLYVEPCYKCGGSGIWTSYHGRCYQCNGTGKLTFKTPRATRDKARAYAATKPQRNWDRFKAASPAQAAWIEANPGFEFAVAMGDAVRSYGHLTPKQAAAVDKCIAAQAARKSTTVQVRENLIKVALETAKANGLKWPKIKLQGFQFSLAPATGKNAGAVYVKQGESYLGKVDDAGFHPTRECTNADEIINFLADPAAAAKAYGQRTGYCCLCSRELTNSVSIELGIGPICRDRFGF